MAAKYIKNVAIVGAGGNVGVPTLHHLLATKRFNITILSRPDSSSSFPSHPSLKVLKGSYQDPAFLASAFADQDAAIFALSFSGTATQPLLIDAAAKAGVKWILPNEYAGDGENQEMFDAISILHPKVAARKQIEDLGLKWIGVVTNPWIVQSLRRNLLGVNVYDKTAKLYDGAGKFNLSSLNQVGLGIARLLSLPIIDETNPRASLENYANRFVYISSLSTSQKELLAAAQRVAGTKEGDWKIDHDSIDARVKRDREAMAQGGHAAFPAMGDLLFAYYIGEGLGGDYQAKAIEDAKILGLQEEDLDTLIAEAVQQGPITNKF